MKNSEKKLLRDSLEHLMNEVDDTRMNLESVLDEVSERLYSAEDEEKEDKYQEESDRIENVINALDDLEIVIEELRGNIE